MPPAAITLLLVEMHPVKGIEILGVIDGRGRAKGKQRLTWRPQDPDSMASERASLFCRNLATAIEEFSVMSFYPVDNRPGLYRLVNDDLHGELTHEIDADDLTCDCMDYLCRGIRFDPPCPCHHLIAVMLHKKRGTLGVEETKRLMAARAEPPEPSPIHYERVVEARVAAAWMGLRPDLDFP